MKHLHKFDSFDFNQTLPATSKNFLTNFYSCDECNAIWKEFNNTADNCKFCNSDEVEELQESEWYEIAKSRLDEDEYKNLESDRKSSSEEFVDLLNLKKEDSEDVD